VSKQVKSNNTKSRSTYAVLSSKGCFSTTSYFFSLRTVAKAQYFPGRLVSVTTSWSSSLKYRSLFSRKQTNVLLDSLNATKMQAGTEACPHCHLTMLREEARSCSLKEKENRQGEPELLRGERRGILLLRWK